LSPRAIERLESHTPAWPVPKIFRLTNRGRLIDGIFKGETINTPSMLCIEDALDGLKWAESIGGLKELIARSKRNLEAIVSWVERTPWIDFLVTDARIRSCTSVCLAFADTRVKSLPLDTRATLATKLCGLLEGEGIAFDINAYRDAPPGLRVWAGATVERRDLEALFPWLDWAYESVYGEVVAAA